MMNRFTRLFVTVLSLALPMMASAAVWVKNPTACPTAYQSQDCGANTYACSYSSSTLYCDSAANITVAIPAADGTTSTTNYSSGLGGGFVFNCVADSSVTCSNMATAGWKCQRDASCYNVHRQTTCDGDANTFSCSATCIANYQQCDGSTTDADGCEIYINGNSSTSFGLPNVVYEADCTAGCKSTHLDCDGNGEGDSGADGSNGCEWVKNAVCTATGGLAGTQSDTCPAICLPNKSNFETGTESGYSTSDSLLWGTQYGTGDLIHFQKNGGNSFVVDNNANVGIGIATPTAQLHTKGNFSTALTGTVSVTTSQTAVTGSGTAFTTELAVGDAIKIGTEIFTVSAIADSTHLTLDSNHSAGAAAVAAYTDSNIFALDNGDGTNKVTVDNSGNVGIGTTSPGYKLDIKGTTNVGISVSSLDNADNPYIQLAGNAGISIEGMKITYRDSQPNTFFDSMFDNDLYGFRFRTKVAGTPVEALTISGSGKVGIGDTSPTAGLTVGDDTSNANATGINDAYVKGNLEVDGSVWLGDAVSDNLTVEGSLTVTGDTSYDGDWDMNSNQITNIGAAGTDFTATGGLTLADDLTVDTDKLFVDVSTGNVGIGTTSPASKLTIKDLAFDTSSNSIHGLFMDSSGDTAGDGNFGTGIEFGRLGAGGDNYKSAGIIPVQEEFDPDVMGLAFFTKSSNFQAEPVSEVMRIGADGNVGIGTTSPDESLHIRKDQNAVTRLRIENSDTGTNAGVNFVFGNGTANLAGNYFNISDNTYKVATYIAGADMFFSTENVERMRIDSTGNLGIGTTTPTAQLHTKGNLSTALTGTVTVTAGQASVVGVGTAFLTEVAIGDSIKIGTEIFTVSSTPNNLLLTIDSNHVAGVAGVTAFKDPNLFAIDNGEGVNKVTIDKKGYVGIGTESPSKLLHIAGTSLFADDIYLGSDKYFRFNAGSTIRENASGTLQFVAENNGIFASKGDFYLNADTDLSVGGDLYFGIGPASTATAKMTIKNSGNVGIGTTSPGSKLGILGGLAVGDATYSDIAAPTGGAIIQGNVGIGTTSTSGGSLNIASTGATPTIYNPTTSNGIILRGDTVGGQLRIVSNTSAWADNETTTYFQAKNGTNNNLSFMGGTYGADAPMDRLQFNSEYTTVTNNAFTDTPVPTATFEVVNDTAARDIMQIKGSASQSGDYLQVTSNGGSAGDLVTVDSSGQIGIGTDSPGAKLHVQGSGAPGAVKAIFQNTSSSGDFRISAMNSTGAEMILSARGTAYASPSENSGALLGHNLSFVEIATNNSAPIHFSPSFDKAMTIIDGGNVGIGTTTPTAQLHTKGNLSTALTGTVTVTAGQASVVGEGTAFLTEIAIGDSIKIGTEVFTVSSTPNNLLLTIDSNHVAGVAGVTAYKDPNLLAVDNGDGVNTFIVQADGKVGIGDSSPTAGLTIGDDALATHVSTGDDVYIKGNLEVDGGVWLGDATSDNFTVQGALTVTGDTSYDGDWDMNSNQITNIGAAGTDFTATGGLTLADDLTVDTDKLFVDVSTGNVGIGTTSPARTLHTRGAGNAFRMDRSDGTGPFVLLAKYPNTTYTTPSQTWAVGQQLGDDFSISDLGTAVIGTGTTVFTIKPTTGNVGIGTTTPSQKLDVTGSIALDGTKLMTLPDQTTLTGSLIYGTGGASLVNTTSTNGRYNTLIGIGAGNSLTTGEKNTANGYQAGYSNTTGSSWTANGYQAGYSNTTGSYWTANGMYAGYSNTTGNNWTANGYSAGGSSITGSGWTANGLYAGYSNTTGNYWTAAGLYAGMYNTTGSNWTVNGYQAGRYLADGTTGAEVFNNSTYIGANTRVSAEGVTNENVFGYKATGVGSNSVVLGDDNVTKTVLKGNVGIGTTSPTQKLDVVGKIALNDGGNSVFVGEGAGLNDDGSDNRNVGIGYQSLYSNTTGSYNTANGNSSLYFNTTGSYNTANGYYSLRFNTTGIYNTANGNSSLYFNTTGSQNTANGYASLYFNTTGSQNTANGYQSLFANTTGSQNTANGMYSLRSNTTGSYNFGLGYQAGRYIADGATANETGTYNTFIGSDTKALADGDTNEIVIGNSAVGIGSNSVVLGNDSVVTTALKGNVGIGTTSPVTTLQIEHDAITNNVDGLRIKNSDSGQSWVTSVGIPSQDETTYSLRNVNAGTNPFVIDYSGNVGIGTTTPASKLDVAGTIRAQQVCDENGANCKDISGNDWGEDSSIFVGVSASSTGSTAHDAVVGYQAANDLCNTAVTGSHVCSVDEMTRTIAFVSDLTTLSGWTAGGTTQVWINSGGAKYVPAASPVDDCTGWTSATTDTFGSFWVLNSTGGGRGGVGYCDTSKTFACCK